MIMERHTTPVVGGGRCEYTGCGGVSTGEGVLLEPFKTPSNVEVVIQLLVVETWWGRYRGCELAEVAAPYKRWRR